MKNAVIIGDSYSTYTDCVPENYAVYYTPTEPASNILKADETWWKIVADKLNLNIVENNSWSGSTIGYRGYDNSDCVESSFIYRLDCLTKRNFFKENNVDIIFAFGGTNDSWADVPLGEEKLSYWEKEDLYNIIPAIYCFTDKLKNAADNCEKVLIINTGLKDEIKETMIKACKLNDVKYVELNDIDKIDGHPSKSGMHRIAEQVLSII